MYFRSLAALSTVFIFTPIPALAFNYCQYNSFSSMPASEQQKFAQAVEQGARQFCSIGKANNQLGRSMYAEMKPGGRMYDTMVAVGVARQGCSWYVDPLMKGAISRMKTICPEIY